MHVVALREQWPGEYRIALVPAIAKRLVDLGCTVTIQHGLGDSAGFTDQQYLEVNAHIGHNVEEILKNADLVLSVRQPSDKRVQLMRGGTVHLSFLDPFQNDALIQKLAQRGITAVSLEMIPRTTRAQKMDALSSQANLAGYATVIVDAYHLPRIFPMMMTAAGTLAPARVFVIGAGVAGLQAIATARRLGARVEAFDTRPVVAEEVRSLGARFVEIDVGHTGQTEQGYARELTPDQIKKQKQGMAEVIARSDVVITTAQVFGRPAPRIVSLEMIKRMRPESVVVDMAVESGGNVEGSRVNQIVEINDVQLVGFANLPAKVATHASEMYAANLFHYVEEFFCNDTKNFELDFENEIAKASVVTHDGTVLIELHNG
ncbi:MAG: Re/Si-specific NAD(P)(+) transhydrogenase subunit alpha [Gammaproteobacteria bacterium]|nr:Re/Si-specific NAD(P)(+) transhydrogenase subunit alpha [Gammaproteobacteria bacterium]